MKTKIENVMNLTRYAALTVIVYLCMFATLGCAPISLLTTEQQSYQSTLNQDQLYVQANLWLVKIFTDSKSIIQFSDKEAGVIAGKYLTWTSQNQKGIKL